MYPAESCTTHLCKLGSYIAPSYCGIPRKKNRVSQLNRTSKQQTPPFNYLKDCTILLTVNFFHYSLKKWLLNSRIPNLLTSKGCLPKLLVPHFQLQQNFHKWEGIWRAALSSSTGRGDLPTAVWRSADFTLPKCNPAMYRRVWEFPLLKASASNSETGLLISTT